MEYGFIAFLIVGVAVSLLTLTRRWVRWPFSLRALFWCGAFSYIILLALPRVWIWAGSDTWIQLTFLGLMAALVAWILTYHNI